jgi:c-di-GMP-binding flagellar brake protein YcgR
MSAKELKELELDFGDVLQLQFLPDDKQNRHYVRVIGYWPDHSIMVTTPHLNGKIMLVRESQRVAVRTMSGVNIIAFTGSVLRSCARPYPYLHISYPKDLQTLALRKAQRVTFGGLAEVRESKPATNNQVPTYKTQVEDMSTSGALLISEHNIGPVKSLISIRMSLHVAGADERFATVAIIRNVKERKNAAGNVEYLYGVEFKIADRRDEILLHAFVNEQLVNG